MKYKDIRKFCYNTDKKVLAAPPHNFDMNNWLSSPYTCLKLRFCIEFASIFVYLLQFTKIKPNQITYIYAFSGLVGGVCLATNNSSFILLGIVIFFSKIVFDGTDGLLARVKYKPTKFGAILDEWGGLVGEYGFIFGLGLYIYNFSGNILHLYLMISILVLKSIDFKKYIYNRILLKKKPLNKTEKEKNKERKFFSFLKKFIRDGFNYQSKTVDLILLIMLIELMQKKLILSQFFLYIYFVRGLIIFIGHLLIYRK